MSLVDLATPTGDSAYYDPGFLTAIYAAKTYLLKNFCTPFSIEPILAYRHEGDFYGLLDDLAVHKQYHPVILILNDYTSPSDLTITTYSIQMPDFVEIDLFKKNFVARKQAV